VTNTDYQDSPGYQTPRAIRDETFQRRMFGGLDQDQVYEYLDRLADQVQATERELDGSRAEVERLRAQLQGAQTELDEYEQVGGRVNEQIVEMYSQAQLVAEEMVEEVSRDARERIGQARAHERKIVAQAMDTAGQEVGSYARSAQARMQSIVDSFASEVERLEKRPSSGESGNGSEPDRSDALFDDWSDWQTPTRNGDAPDSPRSR
jgi:DivIVA domain-containing protein